MRSCGISGVSWWSGEVDLLGSKAEGSRKVGGRTSVVRVGGLDEGETEWSSCSTDSCFASLVSCLPFTEGGASSTNETFPSVFFSCFFSSSSKMGVGLPVVFTSVTEEAERLRVGRRIGNILFVSFSGVVSKSVFEGIAGGCGGVLSNGEWVILSSERDNAEKEDGMGVVEFRGAPVVGN